jgi:hypothetical protein
MPSCIPGASLGSATCIDSAWARGARAAGRLAAAPPIATTSPNYKYERGAVKRFDWVVTWRNLTLDGFQRPVSVCVCVCVCVCARVFVCVVRWCWCKGARAPAAC